MVLGGRGNSHPSDDDIVARHLFLGSCNHGHLPLILYLAFSLAHFKLICPPDLYDIDS